MTWSRREAVLGAVAATSLAVAVPLGARAERGGGFAVSGKDGPFLKQVGGRTFNTAAPGARGSLGLASDAVNLGQYQAARLRMPRTEAAISELLGRLDAQWPYAKGPPVKVEVLGVDYFNAYSLPDQSIVVALGLIDQAQSDDEVAFVLGHELGHLRLGHFNQVAVAEQKPELASRLGQAFLVDAALSKAGGGALADSAAKAAASSDLLHFLVGVSAEPGHTRAQEDEADCVGYDLSQKAQFAADEASARVFDSIVADQQKRAVFTDALNAELKNDLSQVISAKTASAFLAGGFSGGDVRQGLLMGAGRLALGFAARSNQPPPQHRPPEERKRDMAAYSAEAYPEGAPLRDEQHAWLTQVRGSAEYAQGKLAVEAVGDAQKARAAGDYATASAAIARAQATSFRAAPLVLNEAARLRDNMGDTAGADALFMQAHASPDQTVDGYLDHVRMLYRVKQNDRAFEIIRRGVDTFGGDDKPFLSLMIAVSRQAGRDDDAHQYLAQCLATGDEALASDCRLAAGETAKPPEKSHSPFGLPFGLPG